MYQRLSKYWHFEGFLLLIFGLVFFFLGLTEGSTGLVQISCGLMLCYAGYMRCHIQGISTKSIKERELNIGIVFMLIQLIFLTVFLRPWIKEMSRLIPTIQMIAIIVITTAITHIRATRIIRADLVTEKLIGNLPH